MAASDAPYAPHAPDAPDASVLLRAAGLRFAHPGAPVLDGLDLVVRPGLTLVRGGDGRGKTTLLRLLAGELAPHGGTIERLATPVARVDASAAPDDDAGARAWLGARAAALGPWDGALQDALVDGFGLGPHLDKRLSMLSTGTRRKLALVAAFACGAPLVLLDTPTAALDARSRALLAELLADAAGHRTRGWVVAEPERPQALAGVPLAAFVDLGD